MAYEVTQTDAFARWIMALRDRRAQTIITARIDRLRAGNFGSSKSLGGGLAELKIDFGPGYRLYYTIEAGRIVVLLAGSDKSDQTRTIAAARKML